MAMKALKPAEDCWNPSGKRCAASRAPAVKPAQADKAAPTVELVPAHSIPVTTSPDGKCTLRILGPIALAGKVEWYELTVESGGVLASEPHEAGAKEHLSVLSGTLTVQAADSSKVLKAGDSARYAVDVQHSIRNTGKGAAKALLVVEYLH